jgi:hypothetical protein
MTVSDEVDATMGVTASASALHGSGQQTVTAVVTGLPPGSTATLTASVDSSANIKLDDAATKGACTQQSGSSGQTFVCTATGNPQSFVFDATVNKGRPLMTFDLTPVSPLVLLPDSSTHAEVLLGDATAGLTAQRTFARRTQN